MTTFFTSDTHFHHKNIIKFQKNRGDFQEVGEMNEVLIEAWNSKVSKNDIVYHLGDFSFGSFNKAVEILDRLNGRITLIRGNHDVWLGENKVCPIAVCSYLEIMIQKEHIILCHFPLEVWHRCTYGSYHFHGHCHGRLNSIFRRLDVGIDTTKDLAPRAWEEIRSELEPRLIHSKY